MKFFIIILGFALTCNSCIPQRLELSKDEKAMESAISKELGCSIKLVHDFPTIKSGGSDGVFAVFMCDELCELKYEDLLITCKRISKNIIPILSHSASYKFIHFGFSKTKKINERAEIATCTKTFKFLISQPDSLISYKNFYE
jgi:hypothetical protein